MSQSLQQSDQEYRLAHKYHKQSFLENIAFLIFKQNKGAVALGAMCVSTGNNEKNLGAEVGLRQGQGLLLRQDRKLPDHFVKTALGRCSANRQVD